jgi:signal transduction histidine kinase/putative methionine-R-sulfoxide reductase with GAF domain
VPAVAYLAFYDRLTDGVLVTDPSGRLIYANRVARDLLGLAGDEPLPDDVGCLFTPSGAWQALLAEEAELAVTVHDKTVSAVSNLGAEDVTILLGRQPDGGHLLALSHVARELNATVELQRVLEIVLNEALRAAHLSCGDVVLINLDDGQCLEHFGRGCPVEVAWDPELELEIVHGGGTRLIDNLAQARVFPGHPDLQAALAVPFYYEGSVAGVIHLYHHRPIAVDTATVDYLESLAAHCAVAVGNARRYQEQLARNTRLRHRTEQIAQIVKISRVIRSEQPFEEMLEEVVYALQEGVGFNVVLLSLVVGEGAQRSLRRVAAAGLPLHVWEQQRTVQQPFANVEALLQDDYRIGSAYFIPAESSASYEGLVQTFTPLIQDEAPAPNEWHADDLFLIPLRASDGDILGLLSLDDPRDGLRPNVEIIALVEVFANQAAVALENAQLHSASQRALRELGERAERLAVINRLSARFGSTLNSQEIMDTVVDEMALITGIDRVRLILFDAKSGSGIVGAKHASLAGGRDRDPDVTEGLLYEALSERRQPLVIEGAGLDPAAYTVVDGERIGGAGSMLVVPMMVQDRLIGGVVLEVTGAPRRFSDAEVEMCAIVCNQAAIALDNARLYEQVSRFTAELERRVEERTRDLAHERDRISALLRITSELSTSLDLERVLHRSLDLVNEAIGAAQGSIYLLDQATGELVHRAALGWPSSESVEGRRFPFRRGEGLIGWVFKEQRSTIVDDALTDERWKPLPGASMEHRSALAVPLSSSEGVVGVLMLMSPEPNAFSEPQLQLVEAAALQVATAMNNAELFKLIGEQAERLGGLMRAEQEEAAKSAAILESVADGVMVVDGRGRVILFNATAERILELERSQILGKPIGEFIGLWGKAGAVWGAAIDEWTHAVGLEKTNQFLEERLELGAKVVSVHLAPVLSGRRDFPSFLGTVSVFRDITRDVELDRMQREWVSTVSHELRTPMTSIKGYADLLMLGAAGPVSETQTRFLEVIKNNADRLSLLVNDLLDISRIETGRMKLDFRPIDLHELVAIVVDNLHGRVEQEEKEMEIQVRLSDGLPAVWGDIDRVTQILTNLLDNAFNYTPAGGTITIAASPEERIAPDKQAERISVRVIDTGIGVASDEQTKIFDRFYRSDQPEVQRVSGTGLGLAIVNHLVDMHGGRLIVHSEGLGEGSTFSFTLPMATNQITADE